MIGKRTEALLQAAATIYAGDPHKDGSGAVTDAYALLALIEAREPKATTKCYGCGCSGPANCVCPKEG